MAAAQELIAAEIAVATLTGYRRQCCHLTSLVRTDNLDRVTAIDALAEIARSHGLTFAHGDGRVPAIIAEAFAGVEFSPLCAGDAAA